jgi:hypothetical protein
MLSRYKGKIKAIFPVFTAQHRYRTILREEKMKNWGESKTVFGGGD